MPKKWQLYQSRQRTIFLYVMGVAVLWEIGEVFYNLDSYSDLRHYFLDTMVDLGAALIVCVISVIILRRRK